MESNRKSELTILILYKGDSIVRLENVLVIIKQLISIGASVYLREADKFKNGILQTIIGEKIKYEFILDEDPILYKTKHFNEMLKNVTTPLVGIWDTDVIAKTSSIIDCIDVLNKDNAKLALPYNGICLDTSYPIRLLYMNKNEYSILDEHKQKMQRLQSHLLTGGAILMQTETFLELGGENENYYGWGDDDFDRYIRFMNLSYPIYRSQTILYHLTHPRNKNSNFHSKLHQQMSKAELSKTIHQKG